MKLVYSHIRISYVYLHQLIYSSVLSLYDAVCLIRVWWYLQCRTNPCVSAASSMRTGRVVTCTASRAAWVLWSRAPGTHVVQGVIIPGGGSGSPVCWWWWRVVCLHSRQQVYGPNLITVPVKSYMRLLVDEVRTRRLRTEAPLPSVRVRVRVQIQIQILG